ncbi:High affinity Ca2+/Mn2+ P-type ATPase-like protein [Serendipita sp. 399]|nr:High affinity Ca2+/Mn2+ P-type ATPase-like protein [Serendipita sp. 399]
MPLDKKRSSMSREDDYSSDSNRHHQQPEAVSTSSRPVPLRRVYARPATTYVHTPNPYVSQRPPSPPATAYFSGFSNEHDPSGPYREPTAHTDAQAHFAYSTTLRRHHVDASGHAATTPIHPDFLADGFTHLLDRAKQAWSTWRGEETEGLMESGLINGAPKEDQPAKEGNSGQFASWSTEDTVSHFRTSTQAGLPSSAVSSLREEFGYNEFAVDAPESLLVKFVKTIYESPLNLLLLGSALVSALMGNIDDAVSITIAILIVLTVGFVQERRSEKSLEALNKLVPHHCHLVRDGRKQHTLANELLPGDLVTFGVGDRIPADLRITEATSLEIDESSLTGETVPSMKSSLPCPSGPIPLAERSSIAFMGTLVRNGHGAGIVIATGSQTEFGVIFSMMQDVEEKKTPLQHSMDELAQKLSFISFGIIGVICFIGILQSRGWLEMFTIGGKEDMIFHAAVPYHNSDTKTTVSLAVAAIPEGLPIVTTVTLALGVLRMSRKKAIVKKLPSVEALGCVSVVCSDKTGTLTKNELTVTELYTVDEFKHLQVGLGHHGRISDALRRTIEVGNVCNNAFKNSEGTTVGQSTDVALLNVVSTFGLHDARPSFTRTAELPFNSEQKYMAVSGTFEGETRPLVHFKGAVEAILERCKFYYVSDASTPGLDATIRATILSRAQESASKGLRVIAMAYGYGALDSSNPTASVASLTNLIFVGFQAMHDPPRPGVSDAIAKLHASGVKVVMITGDAETTAVSIARELGLKVHPSGKGGCLTGKELDAMNASDVAKRISSGVCVFARTTPRHKMLIVEALQGKGEVVGMTGDGVNDAPALKMADIGISMGKSGTDVAKEAADVILVDDNFATILKAVEEGKSIFHNIQNFLSFQLSTAVAALSLITLSTVFHLSNPLNAMQILFINILMDGPPSQSLGVDPADPTVMRRPPRSKDASILTPRIYGRVLFSASMIILGTLFVYLHELSDGSMSGRDQTMTFTCFVFLDLVSALQNRGLGCGIFQNRMLLLTVSTSFLVQLALIYVPFMQAVFQTVALRARDLSTLLVLAAISMGLHELRRRWERRKYGATGGIHEVDEDIA